MSILNSPAYAVERDKLIYEGAHPIDGGIVAVNITEDEGGVIKRGSIIDFDKEKSEYSLHTKGGTPNRIAAEDTEYAAEDTTVVVSTYMSGTFRASEIIADPELEEADMEILRSLGIYPK